MSRENLHSEGEPTDALPPRAPFPDYSELFAEMEARQGRATRTLEERCAKLQEQLQARLENLEKQFGAGFTPALRPDFCRGFELAAHTHLLGS